MIKLNQQGFNTLIFPLLLFMILFFGAAGFGLWAFMERQDYKDNVEPKIAAAVEVAKQQTAAAKDQEFAEKEKSPLKPYSGPATFGSISIMYPKTWSAFVSETGKGNTPINGYFHPNFVPALDSGTGFALRIELVELSYAQELKKFDGAVKAGTVRVSPYASKVGGVVGARVDGEIVTKKKGSMVLLPLRDKTLRVWTEAEEFKKDFNDIILNSLTFTP